MLDWRNAIEASDYRRDLLVGEVEQDRMAMRATRDDGDRPAGRPSLIGVLVAAMIALVATGAVAPR